MNEPAKEGWFCRPGHKWKPRPPREQFAKAWMDTTLTRAEIAAMFGLSRTTVRIVAEEYGLPLLRNNYGVGLRATDPTPEQIQQRCAEVRRTWSRATLKRRYNKHFAGFV